jgi:hypothetical protein
LFHLIALIFQKYVILNATWGEIEVCLSRDDLSVPLDASEWSVWKVYRFSARQEKSPSGFAET